MRYAFDINGKTYFAIVTINRCAPSEVVVFTAEKHIGTGMKSPFESIQECVERIVTAIRV